ncbi:hypothetical protein QQ045_018615 [Rhodiola kirilowii]
MIGSLQYLTITRPDIAYSVNFISQFMSQPRTSHLVAAKRILRYVKGTIDYGLYFTPQRHPVTIAAYSDADWVGCLESHRSQFGYLIYIGTNLVSWCSKKQPTIARSSAESEYRALGSTPKQIRFVYKRSVRSANDITGGVNDHAMQLSNVCTWESPYGDVPSPVIHV